MSWRSTHVNRSLSIGGGSISVNPSSSQNATHGRTSSARTSSVTCWSMSRTLLLGRGAGCAIRQDGRGMRDLGRPVLAAAAVVVCGAVMTILDSTIVNVAIERLAVAFDARLATIQWVSTGYLLALAAVIPMAGWAVDRFGTRRCSWPRWARSPPARCCAALAWSAGSLIAFRVLQGLGGGLVMPVGMTILARAAGPDRMGRVMALVGVPMLLAPAIGPALGGALIDGASWRLIFFVNLPVAVLALVLAARVLPRERSQAATLDVLGARAALARPGVAGRRARHRPLAALSPGVAPDRGVRRARPAHRAPADRRPDLQDRVVAAVGRDDVPVRRCVLRQPAAARALLPARARPQRARHGPDPRCAGRRRDASRCRSRASSPTGSAPARSSAPGVMLVIVGTRPVRVRVRVRNGCSSAGCSCAASGWARR